MAPAAAAAARSFSKALGGKIDGATPPTLAGSGGAATKANGGSAPSSTSSAGGGGAVGRIRINAGCGGKLTIATSAVVSPYESTRCFTKGDLQ